jgi:hydrogenase expression/formation protein HypC
MCVGTIGRLIRTWDADGVPMGLVRGDAGDYEACLLYTPDAEPGAMVLVHLGFVVEELDSAHAADLRDLRAGAEGQT